MRPTLHPVLCGRTSSGAAYCWGANSLGQVGDGSATVRTIPTLVSDFGVSAAPSLAIP